MYFSWCDSINNIKTKCKDEIASTNRKQNNKWDKMIQTYIVIPWTKRNETKYPISLLSFLMFLKQLGSELNLKKNISITVITSRFMDNFVTFLLWHRQSSTKFSMYFNVHIHTCIDSIDAIALYSYNDKHDGIM